MAKLEEKVYTANKTSLELLQQIRVDEDEILTLKTSLIDFKARASFYQPVKDDPVDLRLAEYLNTVDRAKFARVTFIRESNGFYSFGSRRVQIELTQGKLKVRVGGGSLNIEEFVDQYL